MYMSCTRHRINKGNCGSFSLSVPLFSLRSVPLFSLWYQSIGLVRETAHCFASANISMTETSSEKYLTETMDFYDPCSFIPQITLIMILSLKSWKMTTTQHGVVP
jgi:hypothetical protein